MEASRSRTCSSTTSCSRRPARRSRPAGGAWGPASRPSSRSSRSSAKPSMRLRSRTARPRCTLRYWPSAAARATRSSLPSLNFVAAANTVVTPARCRSSATWSASTTSTSIRRDLEAALSRAHAGGRRVALRRPSLRDRACRSSVPGARDRGRRGRRARGRRHARRASLRRVRRRRVLQLLLEQEPARWAREA